MTTKIRVQAVDDFGGNYSMLLPKFKLHKVDTSVGAKWRVVFPDGFAVRFLTWEKACEFAFKSAESRWESTRKHLPKLSESTLKTADVRRA